ncbi:MAG: hypothetical protein AAF682_20220 [Planctomycetota bacterium]
MSAPCARNQADTPRVEGNAPLLICAGLLAAMLLFLSLGEERPAARVLAPPAPEGAAVARPAEAPVRAPHPPADLVEGRRLAGLTEQPPHVVLSSAARATARVATGPRGLRVVVRDHEGLPLQGVALTVERRGESDTWLVARIASTDEVGEASFSGLWEDATYRVRTSLPSAPAPAPIDASGSALVRISLRRPAPALVELRSVEGHALSGARRVELHAPTSSGTGISALAPASRLGCWTIPLADRTAGLLHVTDSLGRRWSAPVVLAPGETSVATPDERWVAISRAEAPRAGRSRRVERDRLRWSLRLGDGPTRRGSGWLAPNGGFHAVVARDAARDVGGCLELRWNAADQERQLLCGWHPDPALQHIELRPSPIGELSSL